ncbi:MAG: hypothetical protein CMP82_02865 [Gammaproteobacteria bacterium]|nr:hypothetical protein [Gammaproteobacteria bacterium]
MTALKTVRHPAALTVVAAVAVQKVVVNQARATPNSARGTVMNFFLNNPIHQTRLSDEQLEKLARENIEKTKAQQKMKACGCCAEEAKSEKPANKNSQ